MVDFVKFDDKENKSSPRTPESLTVLKRKKRFSFKKLLIIIIVFFVLSSIVSSIIYALTPKVAIIPITGTITTSSSNSIYDTAMSSRSIANKLRKVGQDDSIKAVILDINSPGGSPVASEEISSAIENLKTKKPVYALISDMGASGAFWVAESCDKVYASSMSTVGSIGVTATGFGLENLIKEYNITYRKYTAGKYKDMGSMFRTPTPEEDKIMQGMLDTIQHKFISHVATSRNLTYAFVQNYATGEVFLGDKAKELGFIDEIGYYPDVIRDIEHKVGKTGLLPVSFAPEVSFANLLGIDSMFKLPSTKSQVLLE